MDNFNKLVIDRASYSRAFELDAGSAADLVENAPVMVGDIVNKCRRMHKPDARFKNGVAMYGLQALTQEIRWAVYGLVKEHADGKNPNWMKDHLGLSKNKYSEYLRVIGDNLSGNDLIDALSDSRLSHSITALNRLTKKAVKEIRTILLCSMLRCQFRLQEKRGFIQRYRDSVGVVRSCCELTSKNFIFSS